jgi:hypothetical protein
MHMKNLAQTGSGCISSLLQGNHLPFTPSPLRLNSFRLFVILSLTQLYRYTPDKFLFSTATNRDVSATKSIKKIKCSRQ